VRYFFLVILFIGFFQLNGNSQALVEIISEISFVEVDNQQNIYIVNRSEVNKYSKNGTLLFRYSDNLNGEISALDVTNPLRILVFNKMSNRVVFLNQQLAPISEAIDIYQVANLEVIMAAASYESGFWSIIEDRQSLVYFNEQMVVAKESQNLSSWIQGEPIIFIREQSQNVYVGLSSKVLVFDMFGSYLTTIHFRNAANFFIVENNISYLNNNKLTEYNLKLKSERDFSIPSINKEDKAFCDKNRIYLISRGSLKVFKKVLNDK